MALFRLTTLPVILIILFSLLCCHLVQTKKEQKLLSVFSIVRFSNAVCNGTSHNGTCMTSTECSDAGGSSEGSCAESFGVCCVFELNCESSSSRNCTYFQNPGYSSTVTSVSGSCRHDIHKCQSNICQLRLDFEKFVLANPYNADTLDTATTANAAHNKRIGDCETDELRGDGFLKGFPKVCGLMTGKHVYVDVPEQSNTVSQLSVHIGDQDTSTGRCWSIKISQIPCDASYKAPTGCTQYYTDTSGLIESFNFQSTGTTASGRHLSAQEQVICIRPATGMCSITYSGNPALTDTETLDLSKSEDSGTSANCRQDYLILRGAKASGTSSDKFCGNGAAFPAVTTTVKPYMAIFISSGNEAYNAAAAKKETSTAGAQGFSLQYTQNSC